MKKDTRIIIGICTIFLLAAGLLFWRQQYSTAGGAGSREISLSEYSSDISDNDSEAGKNSDNSQTDKTTDYAVYVSGAVKKPGLFHYSGTARVSDAIESAGGFTKKADKDAINLARILTDGEQILVPRKQKLSSKGNNNPGQAATENTFVNINTASAEELMALPGIGESKAGAIIAYRTKNGLFTKKEDLMKISGIKEGVYNKIESFIVIT